METSSTETHGAGSSGAVTQGAEKPQYENTQCGNVALPGVPSVLATATSDDSNVDLLCLPASEVSQVRISKVADGVGDMDELRWHVEPSPRSRRSRHALPARRAKGLHLRRRRSQGSL